MADAVSISVRITALLGSLLRTAFLGRGDGSTIRSGSVELIADLSPGIGCGTRICHASEARELVIIDLRWSVRLVGRTRVTRLYLGRSGLERLHGPGEYLHLALGEARTCLSGIVSSVGHCG